MGLVVGCAMVPMALALLVIVVVVVVQEPATPIYLVAIGWFVRALWRAHRGKLRRGSGPS